LLPAGPRLGSRSRRAGRSRRRSRRRSGRAQHGMRGARRCLRRRPGDTEPETDYRCAHDPCGLLPCHCVLLNLATQFASRARAPGVRTSRSTDRLPRLVNLPEAPGNRAGPTWAGEHDAVRRAENVSSPGACDKRFRARGRRGACCSHSARVPVARIDSPTPASTPWSAPTAAARRRTGQAASAASPRGQRRRSPPVRPLAPLRVRAHAHCPASRRQAAHRQRRSSA